MTQDEAYKAWWHNEGSGIIPLPNEDMKEFAHRMTQIAWSNGAFKEREACAEICDGFYLSWINIQGRYEFMGEGASECADAIRARGHKGVAE